MNAGGTPLGSANVQDGPREVDLIPTKVRDLGRTQTMPKGYQNHGSVAVAIAVLSRGSNERFNLWLGQIFPRPQIAVFRSPRHDCSIFGRWPDRLSMCEVHRNHPLSGITVRKSALLGTVSALRFLRHSQF